MRFRYRQSNVRRFLPVSDYCRARGNQIKSFRQHSRKLGGAAEQLIDGSEKRICRLSFEFESPHVIEKRSKRIVYNQLSSYLSENNIL